MSIAGSSTPATVFGGMVAPVAGWDYPRLGIERLKLENHSSDRHRLRRSR